MGFNVHCIIVRLYEIRRHRNLHPHMNSGHKPRSKNWEQHTGLMDHVMYCSRLQDENKFQFCL